MLSWAGLADKHPCTRLPRTHIHEEGGSQLHKVVLWPPHLVYSTKPLPHHLYTLMMMMMTTTMMMMKTMMIFFFYSAKLTCLSAILVLISRRKSSILQCSHLTLPTNLSKILPFPDLSRLGASSSLFPAPINLRSILKDSNLTGLILPSTVLAICLELINEAFAMNFPKHHGQKNFWHALLCCCRWRICRFGDCVLAGVHQGMWNLSHTLRPEFKGHSSSVSYYVINIDSFLQLQCKAAFSMLLGANLDT